MQIRDQSDLVKAFVDCNASAAKVEEERKVLRKMENARLKYFMAKIRSGDSDVSESLTTIHLLKKYFRVNEDEYTHTYSVFSVRNGRFCGSAGLYISDLTRSPTP